MPSEEAVPAEKHGPTVYSFFLFFSTGTLFCDTFEYMTFILIDAYLCNSCGTCIEICPEVFRLDEATGKAALVSTEPVITEAVYQAAAFCPEKCIEITET